MLALILNFLFLSIIILTFVSKYNTQFIKKYALIVSAITLLLSLNLLIKFDKTYSSFQFIEQYTFSTETYNINFSFGLDGISIFLFLLTSLLIFLCILFILNEKLLKYYVLNLLIIEFLLFLVFSTLDLFLFYIFFEAILIPMYLLVGVWGSRARKIRAAYLLFFYTLVGSLLMLLGLLYIFNTVGSVNLEYLFCYSFTFQEQYWLWLAFFLSFASKIPVFPLHIWLPEAHVEAPTVGSVLLAGILLKLGVYGFLRVSLTLFPDASLFFSPFLYLICSLGVVYASLTAIRQTDIKRIVAYSSIAHMNLIVIGLFSFTLIGLDGALLQTISHGFVASALFFCIGILYNRYGSRSIFYYGGLVHIMPLYSTIFLLFTLANIALPGTSSFIAEFLLLMGVFKINATLTFIVAISVIIGGSYSLWLYNRLIFGNLKIYFMTNYSDLSLKEFSVLIPLLIPVILIGIYPNCILTFIQSSLYQLVYNISF
jgi:proton-translocating NADH-quinone oxidoreductase chain M